MVDPDGGSDRLRRVGGHLAGDLRPKPAQFTTAPIRRETIVKAISAAGVLQAVTAVQVGNQVSGTISELYADFNSQVHKGQVIARLDPAQLQPQLARANATWLSAQASQQAAENNVLACHAGVQATQANVGHADAVMKNAQATAAGTRKRSKPARRLRNRSPRSQSPAPRSRWRRASSFATILPASPRILDPIQALRLV